ncbi:YhbY family RNA-binding protein [Candidatus Bathyarchaeota archaeon]|nr:YhbY family RNA-binding protein [Candidatus Bathyarchaeota archaeon]
MSLTGEQLRKLKATAQSMKPSIHIGRDGLTNGQLKRIKHELAHHELIKVKFNDYKAQKTELSQEIAARTGATQVGLIGNTLVLYKQSPYPNKRRITV